MDKLKIFIYYLYFKYFLKFSSRDKLEKYQNKKINKNLKYIFKKSKFYSAYKSKKFEEIPIMSKKVFMSNFNLINTVDVDVNEAYKIGIDGENTRNFNPKLKNITVGLSSGTSGHRGIFLVSNKEKNVWVGAILARCLYKGILNRYNIAFFLRADSNLYEGIKSKNINFEYFDMLKEIDKNYEKLIKFNPDILVAPPQVLIQLAKKDISKIKPKKIYSVAEVLEKEDKIKIEKAFNTRVDQIYQCTEGFLGHTCMYGNLHLNEDIVKIEKEYIDSNNEGRFIPIITDFYRTSQPIIRYRLNDILVEDTKTCKCGSKFCVLKKIEGRQDDIFIFKNSKNENLDIEVYPDYIRRCFLFAENISEYRVEQVSKNDMIIYINSDLSVSNKIIEEFSKLSLELNFVIPRISFKSYSQDPKKKLVRVKRLFKVEEMS